MIRNGTTDDWMGPLKRLLAMLAGKFTRLVAQKFENQLTVTLIFNLLSNTSLFPMLPFVLSPFNRLINLAKLLVLSSKNQINLLSVKLVFPDLKTKQYTTEIPSI